ncbi:MAG: hypothetical protein LBT42_05725, partial [Tannerella sp.]|nr:hypothetical protein [Tannerella sp.]
MKQKVLFLIVALLWGAMGASAQSRVTDENRLSDKMPAPKAGQIKQTSERKNILRNQPAGTPAECGNSTYLIKSQTSASTLSGIKVGNGKRTNLFSSEDIPPVSFTWVVDAEQQTKNMYLWGSAPCIIDWGDGTSTSFTGTETQINEIHLVGSDAYFTLVVYFEHTYNNMGEYKVIIRGENEDEYGCPITTLHIEKQSVTALDVRKADKLFWLVCENNRFSKNNQISELDLNHNSLLTVLG